MFEISWYILKKTEHFQKFRTDNSEKWIRLWQQFLATKNDNDHKKY